MLNIFNKTSFWKFKMEKDVDHEKYRGQLAGLPVIVQGLFQYHNLLSISGQRVHFYFSHSMSCLVHLLKICLNQFSKIVLSLILVDSDAFQIVLPLIFELWVLWSVPSQIFQSRSALYISRQRAKQRQFDRNNRAIRDKIQFLEFWNRKTVKHWRKLDFERSSYLVGMEILLSLGENFRDFFSQICGSPRHRTSHFFLVNIHA